ncbi:hypothetical protein DTO96_101738 [Ephemeroptericola cinctiostellae]|uniref:Uncharacterized protein n=1 Tax=Ephemeroptericola cinctiostellae TaxID=2268024 RepID=A0A345DCB0_9BURK|nr:Tm-1-like ATP-binding domain-containing protein [Ephemeroptericola cinctiostellae]AXF85998.1 hypothetical protein DTO96_101738 [Ephemeroptericola cinctiostellae]
MAKANPTILLIGTADTKMDELRFIQHCIDGLYGKHILMDVGVLEGATGVDISNNQVAAAAGVDIPSIIAYHDENAAMSAMALGASRLAAELYAQGSIDGLLVLGGTMGTDLALDVASALPLGIPKVVLSTVSYSPLIPTDRIPPDLTMILWAGGLYGLNSLCKATLSQAAGAVVGAAQAALIPTFDKPIIGMTSLGKTCLKYMVKLKPALEQRGFEVAVFHTTGMGGRAFEGLAAQGVFSAVMDFSLQELSNLLGGSAVHAGETRLLGAGLSGTPQIVAPGAIDMIDMPTWAPVPDALKEVDIRTHNRLISCAASPEPMRRLVAREIVARMSQSTAPSCFILPKQGVQAWDKAGEELCDESGKAAFNDELIASAAGKIDVIELDAHINDDAFVDAVLAVFDDWLARGLIKVKGAAA